MVYELAVIVIVSFTRCDYFDQHVEIAKCVLRTLPEGVHIEWSGEFEHPVRAERTLRFVFPAVNVLIFVILYMTYNDLADAALMMLAVPEALAGGAFFMYFFPKIMEGWPLRPWISA